MKNFKQIALGLAIGAMAVGLSSYTTVKKSTSNFYEYTSSSKTQTDIQSISHYVATASDPCNGTSVNVCGVTLSTAHTIGATPVSSEFNAESANLWTSQENGSPADGNVGMKN